MEMRVAEAAEMCEQHALWPPRRAPDRLIQKLYKFFILNYSSK